jgi:Nucleotide modification associated domain 2
MPKLFSYVVDHDLGFAPNPFHGFCTLAHCKFSSSGRKNIVESAKYGDWIAGTGGLNPLSAGHGKLIYAMRVAERLTLRDYWHDARFFGRADNLPKFASCTTRLVLVSKHFFYFGSKSVDVSLIPTSNLSHAFEKRGPGFRMDFSEEFITDFAEWLATSYRVGVHGLPCGKPTVSWTGLFRSPCRRTPCAPRITVGC